MDRASTWLIPLTQAPEIGPTPVMKRDPPRWQARLVIGAPTPKVLAELGRRGLVPAVCRPILGCEPSGSVAVAPPSGAPPGDVHSMLIVFGNPCPVSIPGVARVLGYTIASEIGDIQRISSPTNERRNCLDYAELVLGAGG